MYRLPFESAVLGIRFQPIYSVAEKMIKAWEVLSLLQPGINHEQYFASQSDLACLNLLCWQLQIVEKMKNRKIALKVKNTLAVPKSVSVTRK